MYVYMYYLIDKVQNIAKVMPYFSLIFLDFFPIFNSFFSDFYIFSAFSKKPVGLPPKPLSLSTKPLGFCVFENRRNCSVYLQNRSVYRQNRPIFDGRFFKMISEYLNFS